MSWKHRGHESMMLISLPGRTFKMSIWNGLSFRSVHFKVQAVLCHCVVILWEPAWLPASSGAPVFLFFSV